MFSFEIYRECVKDNPQTIFVITLILLCLIFIHFVVTFSLILIYPSIKKRGIVSFIIFFVSCLCLILAFSTNIVFLFYPMLGSGFGGLLLSILVFIKRGEIKKEDYISAKEFLRATENNIERSVKRILPQNREKEIVDYSHVKNMMEKLKRQPLYKSEIEQLEELELLIEQNENGKDDYEIRSKINDGLGFLLKIMGKYKV